jgi:hypothetical protein
MKKEDKGTIFGIMLMLSAITGFVLALIFKIGM